MLGLGTEAISVLALQYYSTVDTTGSAVTYKLLDDALKDMRLSETSKISDSSFPDLESVSERMKKYGLSSDVSLRGIIDSIMSSRKGKVSESTSSSSEDMTDFKKRVLNYMKQEKKTSLSSGSSIFNLATTSPQETLSFNTNSSFAFDSFGSYDFEYISILSERISIQGRPLEMISEEHESVAVDKSVNEHCLKIPSESELDMLLKACTSQMQRQGVIKREIYLNFHKENPGFFDFVIYTDDLEKASNQLKKILKYYLSKPKKPIYSPKEDPLYHQVIQEKGKMINSYRSTISKKQLLNL
ncbi:hypothetical protein L9F63_003603 [Diploptera punctata]|uniref:Uncharacterized protein n=1 Tax=Diploptera punctata TaxID=6984 RepID=A0AAD7ZJV5_DIPPU|nr:hypothetical protein L9F63_003603 [Diploptera punctata]